MLFYLTLILLIDVNTALRFIFLMLDSYWVKISLKILQLSQQGKLRDFHDFSPQE